jgi:sirohydrochlorin ferrochelatase
MASVGMRVDLTELLEATAAADPERLAAIGSSLVHERADIDVLIGRVGMIAAHGDADGHLVIMLSAASVLSRWLHSYDHLLGESEENRLRPLPLLIQALVTASQAVRAGRQAQITYPRPYFPSDLPEGKSVGDLMHEAVYHNDAALAERLLFGLYATGADYRTMQARAYEGVATTFHQAGHPLMFAVRGFQLLDPVEWGDRTPNILHWLAPHLPIRGSEPDWIQTVRDFVSQRQGTFDLLRRRISAPRNERALALRELLLGNASPAEVCEAVYETLFTGEASTRAVGSVIALAAADILQEIGDDDRALFMQAAHGLLFAAAVRLVFAQIQDIEMVPLLFTAAVFVNDLRKTLGLPSMRPQRPPSHAHIGGGLLAPALLETLQAELQARDLEGAYLTARRYLNLGYETKPLFATIGLVAAQADAAADQGHTLQIVQAAGEEFMGWPGDLGETDLSPFLRLALRAAALAPRRTLTSEQA